MIKKTEKQVKFKINNFEQISKALLDIEAIFIGGFMERTIRYDTLDLYYSNKGIFIRTKQGIKNVLTVKEVPKKMNNKTLERTLVEVEVDDINNVDYILKKIGLTNKFVMEKYRLYYYYKKCFISIDELPFGVYLEIKGSDKDIKKLCKKLEINENELIKVTYWDLYYKFYKGSNANDDIVFSNNHIFKIATYL